MSTKAIRGLNETLNWLFYITMIEAIVTVVVALMLVIAGAKNEALFFGKACAIGIVSWLVVLFCICKLDDHIDRNRINLYKVESKNT